MPGANDADVQGAALVKGEGLELVITLGTGVGTALFWEGKLAPHLELAQHPLGKDGRTYNEELGEAVREKVGNKKWNARVGLTLAILKALVFYDHCYIGGGNSKRVTIDLPPTSAWPTTPPGYWVASGSGNGPKVRPLRRSRPARSSVPRPRRRRRAHNRPAAPGPSRSGAIGRGLGPGP